MHEGSISEPKTTNRSASCADIVVHNSLMARPYMDSTIDVYLRKRLMPVEGAIPHIPGIEIPGIEMLSTRATCVAPAARKPRLLPNTIRRERNRQRLGARSTWTRGKAVPSPR